MSLKWTWKLALAPTQEKILKVRLDGSKAEFIRSISYESRFKETGWTLPRAGDNYFIPDLGAHIIDRVCFVNARPERRFISTVYFKFDNLFRDMSEGERNIFLSSWNKEKLYRRDFKDLRIPLDDWVDPQIKYLEHQKLMKMSKNEKRNHSGLSLGYADYLLHHFKDINLLDDLYD
jgi:hypothetical protein